MQVKLVSLTTFGSAKSLPATGLYLTTAAHSAWIILNESRTTDINQLEG